MTIITAFLNSLRNERWSPHSIKAYQYALQSFAKYINKSLTKAHTSDIQDWLNTYRNRTPATVNQYLAIIKTFYVWLVDEHKIKHNPTQGIKSIKYTPPLPKPIPPEALLTLFKKLETADLRTRLVFELLAGTGLRISELCNIYTQDISISRKNLLITNGKGSKQRLIPLHPGIIRLLQKYLPAKKNVPLLTLYGKPMSTQCLRRFVIYPWLRIIPGLEKATPHQLRHTFATQMLRGGTNPITLSVILGHASVNTTMRYTQVITQDQYVAVMNALPRAKE